MNISAFAMNESAEKDGVWKQVGDARLLVARANNRNYMNMLRKLFAPYKDTMSANISDEDSERIDTELLAKTILLDWENLTDVEGKVVQYSTDTAFEWLDKYPEFRKLIVKISEDSAIYREEFIETTKEEVKK